MVSQWAENKGVMIANIIQRSGKSGEATYPFIIIAPVVGNSLIELFLLSHPPNIPLLGVSGHFPG